MVLARIDVPGLRPMPIVGAIGNVARFAADPIAFTGRLFASYGSIAALAAGKPTRLVSAHPETPGTVFVYGAELNRQLVTQHEAFHKSALSGPLYPISGVTERTRPLARMLTGLFHVNGDEHRQHRRLLMPAFHKKRIEGYRDDMVGVAHSVLASWQPGAVRDVHKDMMELTLRVATKTLFGDDAGEAGTAIGHKVQAWLRQFTPAVLFPWDVIGSPYRRWLDLTRDIDHAMCDVIAKKRKAAPGGGDMLSTLLEVTDEKGARLTEDELVGHVGVIFAAGHETSSNALCWTLYLLSQHPQVMADLVAELEAHLHGDPPSIVQLSDLVLLDRVIKESMRLLPPAPFNHRLAAGACELGGYPIPQHTEVLVSIYHTHRAPDVYPDPDRFLPERWASFDPGPYAYSPFSAGPRMCIGASFAMMEIKIVLAIILQRFRMELAPGAKIDRFFSITLSPKRGLPMLAHRQDHEFAKSARSPRGNVREMVRLEDAA